MKHLSNPPLPSLSPPRAAQQLGPRDVTLNLTASTHEAISSDVGRLLTGLLADESALYAITREWRYDAAGRKFLRLHALLDEQFTEIGDRLIRIAARSRALGCWSSARFGDRVKPQHPDLEDAGLEAHMLDELMTLHQALLVRLLEGKVMVAQLLYSQETDTLLADLIASHEKDLFMLRALLWEVRNNA